MPEREERRTGLDSYEADPPAAASRRLLRLDRTLANDGSAKQKQSAAAGPITPAYVSYPILKAAYVTPNHTAKTGTQVRT